MWWKGSYFKYITALILLLITIFFMKLMNMFDPFLTIFKTLFYPILIAGFLFYILRPVVEFISDKLHVPNVVAIVITFISVGGILYGAGYFLASTIRKEVEDFSHLPSKLREMADKAKMEVEKKDMGLLSPNSIEHEITKYFSNLTQRMGEHFTEIFTTVMGAATLMIIVPILVFFFLKDGNKFKLFATKFLKDEKKQEAKSLLSKVDKTIAAYIIGQVTVAFVDGVLMYLGYLIIGIPYALLLGIFVMVTAVVPFFGPIIGVIPALIVALMQDPVMAIYVLIILIVVQQLEGNLVAPTVLGSRLKVHPLTIILLLVIAMPLAGFIGMVIAVPLYAVGKVLAINLVKYIKLYRDTIRLEKG
ncbi:AI-2E family transporter [Gracilibacillus kekensis]|uniref:Predicted PurR-regulated permease PerM n=1 Tax=Gracilibacillus kekensis TaxID=1027249 RepID=A0A1M7NY26_9BACI|nr:AI-2E family transporter [Gracilibacillus kekensis]SHN09148.1 Predicted PurR-regulated permease PerM [Gracilibacillus kekensis]